MRLVVWNSCERFDRNLAHLLDLDFDVAIVSEAGVFDANSAGPRSITSVLRLGVDEPGHTKQLGVIAREPWKVEQLPRPVDQPWVVPALVHGPINFTAFAFWALTPRWVRGQSYSEQARRVIDELLPAIEGPVVMAGDFNAPIASAPTDRAGHTKNVAALTSAGIISVFTATRPGADPLSEPTLYHQRKPDRPFHIDHAFVPATWAKDISMTIGIYEDWVATGRSDHVPLIIDIAST